MSDVLVKGMEMPKNCCYCGFVRLVSTKACCFAVHDNHKDDDVIEYDVTEADLADTTDKMQKRPSWCPLIALPDHGDLADKRTIIERMGDAHDELFDKVDSKALPECHIAFLKAVMYAPTVIPSTDSAVVLERTT